MSKYYFGIDLGTTNSCIAVMQGVGRQMAPKVIKLRTGGFTLPSCVMYNEGTIIVGKQAYINRYKTDRVVYSSKRCIGTDKVYHINDGISEFTVTPTDVACEILRELKASAEVYYGEGSVDEIVITVPAYFNYEKRLQTKLAAERAGMNVLGIINEPTAAALSYTLGNEVDDKFLVYDLGGGTFDVTILQTLAQGGDFDFFEDVKEETNKVAQVIASAGDDHLGGDDLDQGVLHIIMKAAEEDLMQRYPRVKNLNLAEHLGAAVVEELLLTIEQHKKSGIDGKLVIRKHFKLGKASREAAFTIGIEEFQQALEPLYIRTRAKIQECIQGAPNTEFGKIVLVGGSTKLELLRNRLAKDFKKVEIYYGLNPDESVALGAAVQASVLKGATAMQVNDVLPQSVGIDCIVDMEDIKLKGRYQKILSKDSPLPAEAWIPISTLTDSQQTATVAIYQGEDSLTVNNTYLGSITIDNIPKRNAGGVDMRILMRVDANGLLFVSVNTEGKLTDLVLKNILKPDAAPVNTMLRKMYASLESAIQNASINQTEREQLLCELTQYYEQDHKIPASFSAKVRALGQKTLDAIDAATTAHFAGREGYIQTAVLDTEEGDPDGEEAME